jgi:hypothetical protein
VDAYGKTDSISSGTTVEFYLNSHVAIQGNHCCISTYCISPWDSIAIYTSSTSARLHCAESELSFNVLCTESDFPFHVHAGTAKPTKYTLIYDEIKMTVSPIRRTSTRVKSHSITTRSTPLLPSVSPLFLSPLFLFFPYPLFPSLLFLSHQLSELELITYWSTYTYCRCNKSVSLATPAYYAHWAAK